MNNRERFIAALQLKVPDFVPTFELVYFLTMELAGKVHPRHRQYLQWDQMSERERRLHIADMADTYLTIARSFNHSAIFVHSITGARDSLQRIAREIRRKSGDEYFLMCHGDTTLGVPSGNRIMEFSCRMVDDPESIKEEQKARLEEATDRAASYAQEDVLDGFALCADYCFNTNPFFSPDQFAEFVAPFLKELIDRYRELGFYTIKHTDGNIMPIIKQIVDCKPDALHSLDPQAGVDIAEVKRLYGDRICLIGNVNCGLLQTGSDAEVLESARYALENGKPNGGYIFSTSNCVYTGMDPKRYELMLTAWEEGRHYHPDPVVCQNAAGFL